MAAQTLPVTMSGSPNPHRIVIIGGGFGGLHAARALRKAPATVTLIDRRNFHLFQPLLYQVATGGLSPADIASPLRAILRKQANTRVLMAEVTGIDTAARRVHMGERTVPYDTLIVAAGGQTRYFGHDDWQRYAPGLKSIEDALAIRARIFTAFERAEQSDSDSERSRLLTFVVIGGGPTGGELAGALGEIARYTLKRDYRNIDPASARILLLEAGPRILATMPPSLSRKAQRSLERLGVTVRTGCHVRSVDRTGVDLECGDRLERIEAGTVLWAAGVRASDLARSLVGENTALLDRAGRIRVQPDLTVPGHPEIFVIGDMADFSHQTGEPLPGIAPVAISQARFAARVIRTRLAGTAPPARYRYFDRGMLATIGRAAAVAHWGPIRLSGYPAWLLWLFVHLMKLVEFENRVLVFVQWAWNYFTRSRGARLITGPFSDRPY